MWSQIRTPSKLSPSARSGHAAARAGHYLYIFGGEADGHPTNDMWRFHFGNYYPTLLAGRVACNLAIFISKTVLILIWLASHHYIHVIQYNTYQLITTFSV